jgi:hypothetical protein
MNFRLWLSIFLLFFFQITQCVPVLKDREISTDSTKISIKNSTEEALDTPPCDEDLQKTLECPENDKSCSERVKRHSPCAQNSLQVQPEVVPTIDDSDYELDDLQASQKPIERNIIIEDDNETHMYRGFIESGANITTVIRLTNLIENKNIIDIPTTLNNTNVNNVFIFNNKTSEEGGKFGLGYNEDGPCCFSVGEKSCKRSTLGLKCHHKKEKVCGKECTSRIIRQKKKKTQPSLPNQWQYGYPGYPGYQQQIPAFYPPPSPTFNPPNFPGYFPQNQPQVEYTDDEDDSPSFEEEAQESGWIAGPEKCKVVSEDGREFTDCSQLISFEHPFARNSESESKPRKSRHVSHQRLPQTFNSPMPQTFNPAMPPMPFYPVVYQPVYMMPQMMPYPYLLPPYSMPQYQYPQPQSFQPLQIPQPGFASDETDEVDSYQKFRKHSPIVMEIDEEL